MKTLAVFTGLLCVLTTGSSLAHDIIRHASPSMPIASSVLVPAGSDLLFVSGTLADVADPSAPAGSIERFGDTRTQAKSVLGKVAKELQAAGFTMADVVKMNVFLVGDPRKGGAMDFDGLMKAYLQFYGLADPWGKPAGPHDRAGGRAPDPGSAREIEAWPRVMRRTDPRCLTAGRVAAGSSATSPRSRG